MSIVIAGTQYIGDLSEFLESVINLLKDDISMQIFISGAFDTALYKEIMDMLLKFKKVNNCRLIIPYVTSTGAISRPYINKLSANGGQVRINSHYKKNLLVLGSHAFLLSFSNKYHSSYGFKTKFECSMLTEDGIAVQKIRDDFMSVWAESLPLAVNDN
jgi:hypothetical protein